MQINKFGSAQPASVESLQNRAVADSFRRGEVYGSYNGVDFLYGQYLGQMDSQAGFLQEFRRIGVEIPLDFKEMEKLFDAAYKA